MSSDEEEDDNDDNEGEKQNIPRVIAEEEVEEDFSDDDELEDIANGTITKSQIPKHDNNGNEYDDDFEAMKEMGF
ncbi:unnamed protein product [[Candida] boidinii]|nr:unnamed protein product [[Candida] boidinii]